MKKLRLTYSKTVDLIMKLYALTFIAALFGLATSAQAQDIDLSAFENLDLENLDLEQFQNMLPDDMKIDLSAMSALPTLKPGPSVPCTEDEDPDVSDCTPRRVYVFFQDFNARLADRVRSGPYNVSPYQYTRDCMLGSSIVSNNPFVGNGSDETLFDLRAIHNMNFWTDAFGNLNHGRTEDELVDEVMSEDTKITELLLNNPVDSYSGAPDPYLQDFYDNCDTSRSTLGGRQEQNAPSGTITSSEYVNSNR